MSDLKIIDLPECPVSTTALLIGDHWKILIVRELLEGTKRFGEIKNGLDGISNKVLSQHLKIMEKRELVIRHVYSETPLRVEYSLSEIGMSLKPLIQEMFNYGEKYKTFIKSSDNE